MTPDQTVAERLAAAQAFLDQHAAERPVEAAWGRTITGDGDHIGVVAALARFQNADGGFGNGLEPDISAPQSNPFAARLVLQLVHETRIPTDHAMVTGLVEWLERTQADDGCWRFAEGTLDHPIAPWFRDWPMPSLNPAVNLSGWLTRLKLGSERLHGRCRALYGRLAEQEEITSGDYYTLLPYAESLPWLPDLPDRDGSLEALALHIARNLAEGTYEAPQQAAEHIGPPDGPVARRLPSELIAALVPRLLEQQQPDGHWQTPYDPHWNPYQTVSGMAILAHHPGLTDPPTR